ncbi:hypothetical protein KOM00_19985, partial [Geomonas sp. Red69]|uniref:hypothetical protein n=1 Tax=Geomonas diazotrophica TaxID=2843197 RepID=UPI001C10E025
YLVFKDQAAVCDRLSTLPEPEPPVKIFFQKTFEVFAVARSSRSVPKGFHRTARCCCDPSSCRVVYSVAKNVVAAESSFIAKGIFAVNDLMSKIL